MAGLQVTGSRKHLGTALAGWRARLEAALGEVEEFLAPHLRRIPVLAPYAEKPHSTRLVYLLAAAPLLAILLPMLLLGGALCSPLSKKCRVSLSMSSAYCIRASGCTTALCSAKA